MTLCNLSMVTTITASLVIAGCITEEGASDGDDGELAAVYTAEKLPPSRNGLLWPRAMTVGVGFRTYAQLSTQNGLSTVGSETYVNGLATARGKAQSGGVLVNCAKTTVGDNPGQCSGQADGLLSNTTGVLRNKQGLLLTKYIALCALNENQTLKLKRWDGEMVKYQGKLGLASSWLTEPCDTTCQEKVSACLFAHVNGHEGRHVPITVTSPDMRARDKSVFKYQEGAFYGNWFLKNPKAYMAVGRDFQTPDCEEGIKRPCADFSGEDWSCMIKYQSIASSSGCKWSTGRCQQIALDETGDGIVSKCTDTEGVAWNNVITIWRHVKANRVNPGETYTLSYEHD